MLESLRRSAGSWIVKAFLGLLVLSFAVWGIGPTVSNIHRDTVVAKIGDVSISPQQFERAFNRQLSALQRQLGGAIDAQQALQLGLDRRTLDNLVTQALYDQAVQDLGLTVSIDSVRKEIADNKAFYDELGQFNALRFQQVLQQNGFSEPSYIAQRQVELARQQLYDALVAGGHAPKKMVELIYARQQQRRAIEMIELPFAQFTAPAEADDATLTAYHQEHARRYTAPELRTLTYVTVSPADLVGEIAVDPAEVRAAYDARLSDFSESEAREVEQIIVPDEALAQKIADRLSEGGDFHAVAKELAGRDPDTLGAVHKGELTPEVEDTVFSLTKDVPSEPVKSPFGWHVFQVTKITPARQQSFEEVRPQIEQSMKLERAGDALYDLSNRIEDAFAGGAKLPEVAHRFNLTLKQTRAVSASGTDIESKPVEDLPDVPGFLETAFQTAKDEEPVLHDSDSGVYFLVQVDSIAPEALRPLADVRARVLADWQADQQRKAAEAKAKELAEQVRGGAALASVAQLNGFEARTTEPLTRTQIGAQAGLDRARIEAVFDLKRGGVTVGANPAKDRALVVRLAEIKAVDPSAEPKAVETLARNLNASVASDVVQQYQKGLEESLAVEINQHVIDAMLRPDGAAQ